MTTRRIVQSGVLWLLLSAAACADTAPVLNAKKPTRQEIIAFAAKCKRLEVQMDLVGRFGTDFSGLDLRGVDFRGAYVGAQGKHRPGLETILRGANFTNCNLRGANFLGSILDGADFTGADLSDANCESASLRHVTLRNVNVTGTRFFYSRFAEANMAGLDLSQSDITGASFPGADLSGSTLAGTKFHFSWQVDFQKADLSDADLHGLTLSHSNFQNTNLRSADLSGCDLKHSDFSDANLRGANLMHARVGAAMFHNVRGLSHAEIRKLTNAAWRFVLRMRIVAFLDSFAFPVCLILSVPLVAIATRAVRWRPKRPRPDAPARFQFSLSTMLWLTTIIGGFIGVALLSPTGAYSYAMVFAFYMMIAEIVRERASRKFALGLLAAALVYVSLNVAVYVVIVEADPFSLFNPIFMVGVTFIGPLAAIVGAVVAAIIVWRAKRRFPVLALVGFAIWMAGVGFANLWAIASASASV